ncbi:MAG: hypothetical protein ACK4VY_09860 [Brevundimonas sp.]
MTAALARALPTRQADQSFRHYRIVAADKGGVATAIAYAGMTRVHRLNADTVEEAVQAMEIALDARLAGFLAERDPDGWPSVGEYRDVLFALPEDLRDTVLPVLAAHARLPGARAAIADLARITGGEKAAVFADYRKLGRRLFTDLRLAKQRPATRDIRFVLDAFALCDLEETAGYPVVQLRPAFVEALS